jgi:3',5'-cyclic AMP phosphodiesterase CpdA
MRPSLALVLLPALLLGCPSATPPPVTGTPPTAGVTRYLVGGDSRNDSSRVVPWAFREAVARRASAFFFLGDMALSPGFISHFASELDALGEIPFYPALGNHEVKVLGFMRLGQQGCERAFRERFLRSHRTPVTSSFEDRVVYSVDLPGSVHFIALDNVSEAGFGADQLAWLAKDLERARSAGGPRYILVGMHKPLARNGVSAHGMDADGGQAIADSDAALALFVKAKVSLILASHVHQFAAFSQAGIRSYITGGLGAPLDAAGPEHAFHHFLQLDVTDGGIDVAVVRFDGKPSLSEGAADDD